MSVQASAFVTTGPLPSRRSSFVSRSLSSRRQSCGLLDGLRAIVRLQRDGPRARRFDVDPCELLNAAVVRNTPLLIGRSLALGAVAQTIGAVTIDRSAVDSVLDNLVASLATSATRGTQIWMSIDREGTWVVLRVAVEPRDEMPARISDACEMPFIVATRIATLLSGDVAVEETAGGRAWRVRLPL